MLEEEEGDAAEEERPRDAPRGDGSPAMFKRTGALRAAADVDNLIQAISPRSSSSAIGCPATCLRTRKERPSAPAAAPTPAAAPAAGGWC